MNETMSLQIALIHPSAPKKISLTHRIVVSLQPGVALTHRLKVLKVPHRSMLTLACVVHAHWCFHGNGGAAWAVAPPEREGQRRAAFHRASTNTESHMNQITPKQHYNAHESSLFTHTHSQLNRYF